MKRSLLAVVALAAVAMAAVALADRGQAAGGGGPAQVGVTATAEPTATALPELRVTVKALVPFVMSTKGGYQGFSIDLLDAISRRAHFTYRLSEVPTVPDQLDSVTSGAADLSIAGISITSDRSGSVDFSQPYYNSGLQILTVPKSSGVASYFGTLTSKPVVHLAIAVLVLLILVAHIVWLVDRRRPDFPAGYLHGLGHGLWWAATSLANVGYGERKPKSAIGRILTVVWMLVAVLVIADYTATVTSAFTVQNLNSAIGGPDDLPGKRVASVKSSTASSYVESHKLDATLVAAIDDAYRLLADGKVDAVVYDSPVLRYYANTTGKGQAIVVGPVFEPQSYGIAMPVGSVWRRPIDQAILSVMEDGTYARLQQAWFGSAQPG